jgi:hypothetical protein
MHRRSPDAQNMAQGADQQASAGSWSSSTREVGTTCQECSGRSHRSAAHVTAASTPPWSCRSRIGDRPAYEVGYCAMSSKPVRPKGLCHGLDGRRVRDVAWAAFRGGLSKRPAVTCPSGKPGCGSADLSARCHATESTLSKPPPRNTPLRDHLQQQGMVVGLFIGGE